MQLVIPDISDLDIQRQNKGCSRVAKLAFDIHCIMLKKVSLIHLVDVLIFAGQVEKLI